MPHKKLNFHIKQGNKSCHNVVRLLLAEQTKLVKVLVRLDLNTQKETARKARESSCEIDAKLLEVATRGHWGVECLHWMLDVVFREDKLRYRERIGAQNLSTIRKIILGVLAQDKTLKCGREGKRLIASSDPKYRELILKSIF